MPNAATGEKIFPYPTSLNTDKLSQNYITIYNTTFPDPVTKIIAGILILKNCITCLYYCKLMVRV
jgi:hypothetical protein